MRRLAGIFLLSVGSVLIFLGIAFAGELLAHKVLLVVIAAFWALLLIYNWSFGSNRGHIAHFLSICGFFSVGVLLVLSDFLHPGLLTLSACGGLIAIFSIYFTLRHRKKLYDNYRRNHWP